MARKSRKVDYVNVGNKENLVTEAENQCEKVSHAALYARLSYESEKNRERNTIETQMVLLHNFVKEQKDIVVAKEYYDISKTGTNFERDGFNEMMQDIKEGNIDCVIVKDLSRLGRNYVEAGSYIERVFPFFNVRFISVNDHYDSFRDDISLLISMSNVYNEFYSRDLAKKIRSSYRTSWANGEFPSGQMAYGYEKDKDNPHQLIPDPVAAPVVKKIFQYFIDGMTYAEIDGEDKEKFYIFDFCGNFEFFRMNKGKATANMMALQGAIFNLKFEISYKLQDIEYQIDRLVAYRKALVMQMSEKVRELPRDNFAVRQHLKYVDLYSSEENYNALTYEDTLIVKEEVAPLILSDGDEASAVRFDALMYGIELAYLAGKKYSRARSDLHKKIAGIASVANIPEIQAQTDLINKVLNTDYVDTAGINEFEEIREKLRNLMKYLPNSSIRYDTNFTDEVLSTEWNESELENDDLKNYKAKAEYYIRQHQDNIAIAKLKRNKPLTSTDIAMLEEVLWSEVGTKQDYEQEFGEKPLGEFVREIVGLDMNAAKEAFSEYLTNASLDSRQIYFVNQIVEYIVHNGMMKDLSVLQESPFTDRGSVVEIFTDLSVWMGIRKVIDMINANAVA